MDKYIIIKELPDASVGTEVIWDESANAFYYEKSVLFHHIKETIYLLSK